MSQDEMRSRDVANFNSYLKRKALRDARHRPKTQQEEIPPLTSERALIEARLLAAKFASMKSLAQDIDRQQEKLGQRPSADNLERARADYFNELRQARKLKPYALEDVVKNMFAGYSAEQTAFLNSRFVAYARTYIERFDTRHRLPVME